MSAQPVVSTFEEGSIADTASRARQLLIFCQESTTEEPQRLALTQLARFNLWASNIGVFASQHASLDYRLRTALSVRAAVEGNLEIICKHFLTILKASPELSEEEFDALFDTPQSRVSVFAKSLFSKSTSNDHMRVEVFKLVETKITLLHQLSLAIRRASNRDNLTRIPKLFDTDMEYIIVREQDEDGSSSEMAIESVRFDIGAEFEEYVRKALTHRWLRHRSNDEENLDKEQHDYRQTLLERCISAVSTRRRQLNYFRAHQNRLEHNGRKLFRPLGQQSATRDDFQTGVHPKEKGSRAGLLNEPRLDQPSKRAYEPSNYTHEETVVSEFNVAKFKLPPASSAPSSSASTTANGGFGGDGPFAVPQPPKLDPNEKEKACPFCYLILPARTFSTQKRARRWERHLLEDLQPYVCLYPNCATPGKTYSSFGAWKSHLSQPHYHSWQCSLHQKDNSSNVMDDESVTFKTFAEFKSHLKIFHPDCEPTSAKDPSQHTQQLAALPQWCFVCFKILLEPAVLLQHMTNHFKSMSLLALPWRDDIAEDEATASDKIVNSDVTDAQDDALDTDFSGIAFGGGEEAGEIATETTRASDVQEFASLLSVLQENPITHQDRLQSFEEHQSSQTQTRNRPQSREDFHIAVICALPFEYDAVSFLFDQVWDGDGDSYGRARGDTNTYTTGRIGQYDVVLALLPDPEDAADGAAASLNSSYPHLDVAFLVGICSGVPGPLKHFEDEIHLGDVVISTSIFELHENYFHEFYSHMLPKYIQSIQTSLERDQMRDILQQKASLYLEDLKITATKKKRWSHQYLYPGMEHDKRFIATYPHKHRGQQPCDFCDSEADSFCEQAANASCAELGCDETNLVKTMGLEPRDFPGMPTIFAGRILSGKTVVKSGEHRDMLAQKGEVIAFDMKSADMGHMPRVIVKGVCDYADGHKSGLWSRYAAATAASVLKAILERDEINTSFIDIFE